MRKRDGFIITAAAVLIATAMMLPRFLETGFSVHIGIGWLCESVIQFLIGIVGYYCIREYRYRKLKGCKVYRFYRIPDAAAGAVLLAAMAIYLVQNYWILNGGDIIGVTPLYSFYWMILLDIWGWFSNCIYINDRICYIPTHNKEFELQTIINYNIENKTASVFLLELITEERSYKVTASRYMTEGFQKAYSKEVGLKVY
ncbi:hypothetical protein [Anaerocolumna xylanovorans]|uniref:Uncharacterized protein n=1 Tax=Anaerocolumna xylanovorans DSM 12503 TaxID=1121345 RepID=A0A1M7YK56_9FIRM|nr:hypothetical protein [Anaerocolumna xylanovorans]SHO52982.1 hypothetical protein SAMN02745217_03896 [Anaerocolumna xylanovorans DSM 12503]